MRAKEFITELAVDNHSGWGATPNNANIDYIGITVLMAPHTFLNLAPYLRMTPESEKKIEAMADRIRSGGTFGAPTLYVSVPSEWKQGDLTGDAQIESHEGRHRMAAQRLVDPYALVETHIIFKSRHCEWRNRYGGPSSDYKPELIDRLNNGCKSEVGLPVTGPLFKLGK